MFQLNCASTIIKTKARFHITVRTQIKKSVVYFSVKHNVNMT